MKLLIIHNKYQSNNIGGEDIAHRSCKKNLVKTMFYVMRFQMMILINFFCYLGYSLYTATIGVIDNESNFR